MEAHCITKIAIVVEQHIRKIACSFPRSQIVLLATKTDKPHRSAGATQAAPLGKERRLLMESHHDDNETNLRYQNRFDKPHRSAGATQAAPLGEEQRLLMGSHHEGDETKGSVYFFVQDYIEAREASGSVRTALAGPKDLTVTQLYPDGACWEKKYFFCEEIFREQDQRDV